MAAPPAQSYVWFVVRCSFADMRRWCLPNASRRADANNTSKRSDTIRQHVLSFWSVGMHHEQAT